MSASSTQAGREEKKARTAFSPGQLCQLDEWFANNRFPQAKERKEIASKLNVNPHSIQIWFQNKRAKDRRKEQKLEEVRMKKFVPKPPPFWPENLPFDSNITDVMKADEDHSSASSAARPSTSSTEASPDPTTDTNQSRNSSPNLSSGKSSESNQKLQSPTNSTVILHHLPSATIQEPSIKQHCYSDAISNSTYGVQSVFPAATQTCLHAFCAEPTTCTTSGLDFHATGLGHDHIPGYANSCSGNITHMYTARQSQIGLQKVGTTSGFIQSTSSEMEQAQAGLGSGLDTPRSEHVYEHANSSSEFELGCAHTGLGHVSTTSELGNIDDPRYASHNSGNQLVDTLTHICQSHDANISFGLDSHESGHVYVNDNSDLEQTHNTVPGHANNCSHAQLNAGHTGHITAASGLGHVLELGCISTASELGYTTTELGQSTASHNEGYTSHSKVLPTHQASVSPGSVPLLPYSPVPHLHPMQSLLRTPRSDLPHQEEILSSNFTFHNLLPSDVIPHTNDQDTH